MKSKIQNFLESKWFLPILFTILLILWACGQTLVTLAIIALAVVLQFVFCDNVINVFGPVIFIPFFMEDLEVSASWVYYIICISAAFLGIIYFVIKKVCFEKKHVTKGKMFWAWIVSMVAFMLGGVIGHFNYLATLVIIGTGLLVYFFYFLAVNFTSGLKERLAYTFIVGGILIFLEYAFLIICEGGNIFDAIVSRGFIFIGAEGINTVAIFYCLAIISCFVIGIGNKFDYLYFLLSVIFEGLLFLTYSRWMILISILVIVPLVVIAIIKSKKKLNFLWVTLGLLGFVAIMIVIFRDKAISIVTHLFDKNKKGSNGRGSLWPWCIDRFKEYPIFGYGFVADELVPAVREYSAIILAHNTILQWITSCGIVGTLMMAYFYFIKYRIMFTKINFDRLLTLFAIIMIALSGMLDQAATMDFFMYLVPFMYLAIIENENKVDSKSIETNVKEKIISQQPKVKTNKQSDKKIIDNS